MVSQVSPLAGAAFRYTAADRHLYARHTAWRYCTADTGCIYDHYGDQWHVSMAVAILDKVETKERASQIMTSANLLAVFAHPDDESFRPGGTLALLARRGVRAQVLTATRGEAGSRGNPPLCSPAELPAMRETELRCACKALGIQPPILLDYQDGQLAEADPGQLAAQILQVVNETHP